MNTFNKLAVSAATVPFLFGCAPQEAAKPQPTITSSEAPALLSKQVCQELVNLDGALGDAGEEAIRFYGEFGENVDTRYEVRDLNKALEQNDGSIPTDVAHIDAFVAGRLAQVAQHDINQFIGSIHSSEDEVSESSLRTQEGLVQELDQARAQTTIALANYCVQYSELEASYYY